MSVSFSDVAEEARDMDPSLRWGDDKKKGRTSLPGPFANQ
jgi:hypothetical protein